MAGMAKEINSYLKQHKLNVEGALEQRENPEKHGLYIRMDSEELRNDEVSHFICRLAYCRNDELKRWFVAQETRLFGYRLDFFTSKEKLDFLRSECEMEFEQLNHDHEDWQKFKERIVFNLEERHKKRRQTFLVENHAEQFIKIPFKQAINLVSNRNCFLFKGFSYVHIDDLNTICKAQFKNMMFKELGKAHKFLSTILADQRLAKILIDLGNPNQIEFNLQEVTAPTDTEKISLSQLNYYQKKSFPPCMKALFTALSNKGHLKHFGRLQLGLFLKGIGLSVEESLQFWRQHFKVDGDKFEKQYAYNIRHSYGQEGKRNDYKPWSCQKVIGQQPPGNGEFHGCPFKTFGESSLIQLLGSYGLTSSDIDTVVMKNREKLHQVACLRLYELAHPDAAADNVGNHPNAFFASSASYLKSKAGEKKEEKK